MVLAATPVFKVPCAVLQLNWPTQLAKITWLTSAYETTRQFVTTRRLWSRLPPVQKKQSEAHEAQPTHASATATWLSLLCTLPLLRKKTATNRKIANAANPEATQNPVQFRVIVVPTVVVK